MKLPHHSSPIFRASSFIPHSALLLTALLGAGSAQAQFTAQQTGNYNATGTWTGGVVPGSNDLTTIAGGFTVTVLAGDNFTNLETRVGNNNAPIGSGTLTLSGGALTTGDLRFLGTNAQNGTVNISGGLLTVSGDIVAGNTNASARTINLSSGTLEFTGAASAINNNGASTITFNFSGGTLKNAITVNPNITLTNTGTVQADLGKTTTIAGVISSSGSLSKTGAGTLTLTKSNTYTGNTTISNGTLDLSTANAQIYSSGTAVTTPIVTVSSGGVLVLAQFGSGGSTATSLGNLSGAATKLVVDGGKLVINDNASRGRAITVGANGATLEVNTTGFELGQTTNGAANSYTDNSTLTLTGTGSATISKAITGTGVSVVKNGLGTWVIAPYLPQFPGGNTYTGVTNVTAGRLLIGDASALGSTAAGTVVTSGATLGANSAVTVAGETLSLNGTGSTGTNGALYAGGSSALGWQGAITLAGNTLMHADGGSSFSLSSAATIDLGGNTLTVDLDGSAASTFGGIISNGSLVKSSTSTLNLTAANSYSGATRIDGGTLKLGGSGSIDNTSGVILGGGTLDVSAKGGGYAVNNLSGDGAVLGTLTVSTQLAIGSSPGQISFENLTLGASSNFNYEFTGGGSAADLGLISGNLSLILGANLNLFQLGSYNLNETFTLFAYDGSLSGTFAGLVEGGTKIDDLGGLWRINYSEATGGANFGGDPSGLSFVNITAIPEPSASALLGLLGVALLTIRRRA